MNARKAYDVLARLVDDHGHPRHREALDVVSALVHDGTEVIEDYPDPAVPTDE